MGLTVFHLVFMDISLIQFECGEYPRLFHGILSVPHSIVMNLNNVIVESPCTISNSCIGSSVQYSISVCSIRLICGHCC